MPSPSGGTTRTPPSRRHLLDVVVDVAKDGQHRRRTAEGPERPRVILEPPLAHADRRRVVLVLQALVGPMELLLLPHEPLLQLPGRRALIARQKREGLTREDRAHDAVGLVEPHLRKVRLPP